MITKITKENKSELSKGVIVLDIYADWCGPCRLLAPIIAEIAKDAKNFKVFKIDADANKDLASEYNVSSLPTILFLNDGKIMDKHVGYAPKELILEKVNNLLK